MVESTLGGLWGRSRFPTQFSYVYIFCCSQQLNWSVLFDQCLATIDISPYIFLGRQFARGTGENVNLLLSFISFDYDYDLLCTLCL